MSQRCIHAPFTAQASKAAEHATAAVRDEMRVVLAQAAADKAAAEMSVVARKAQLEAIYITASTAASTGTIDMPKVAGRDKRLLELHDALSSAKAQAAHQLRESIQADRRAAAADARSEALSKEVAELRAALYALESKVVVDGRRDREQLERYASEAAVARREAEDRREALAVSRQAYLSVQEALEESKSERDAALRDAAEAQASAEHLRQLLVSRDEQREAEQSVLGVPAGAGNRAVGSNALSVEELLRIGLVVESNADPDDTGGSEPAAVLAASRAQVTALQAALSASRADSERAASSLRCTVLELEEAEEKLRVERRQRREQYSEVQRLRNQVKLMEAEVQRRLQVGRVLIRACRVIWVHASSC